MGLHYQCNVYSCGVVHAMIVRTILFSSATGNSNSHIKVIYRFLRAEGNRLCVKMANDLVSRTGRLRQRYDNQCRLVAGCIPYRYKEPAEACSGTAKQELEVLMIFSRSGKALLFPKGGWENDESVQEAACREAFEEAGVRGIIKEDLGSWEDDRGLEGFHRTHMFALLVTEELDSWPEQDERQRKWVTITEADAGCKHDWMRQALHSCVTYLSSIQEAICAHPVRPLQTYRRRSQDSSHGTNRQDTSQAWLWVTASSQTYLRPDLPALPDPLTNHLIGVSSLWSQMLER